MNKIILASSAFLFISGIVTGQTKENKIVRSYNQEVIGSPPVVLSLDTFYKKYTDAFGIPIVSSEKVPDDALLIARDIVN